MTRADRQALAVIIGGGLPVLIIAAWLFGWIGA